MTRLVPGEFAVVKTYLVVGQHSFPELSFVDDFANVLENELAGHHVLVGTKTKSLFFRLDDSNVSILFALEALVLTLSAAATVVDALHFRVPVDAVGIFAASSVDLGNWVCAAQ